MASGFGGAGFGSLMGYSYYGIPAYHKGKIRQSWFVKSPLTRKLNGMKKTKSKVKSPGSHPAGYVSNKPQAARGSYNLGRKKRR